MVCLEATRRLKGGRFVRLLLIFIQWRFLALAILFVFECMMITGSDTKLPFIDKLPFQQILLAHKAVVSLSIGIGQLGPLLFGGNDDDKVELILDQLGQILTQWDAGVKRDLADNLDAAALGTKALSEDMKEHVTQQYCDLRVGTQPEMLAAFEDRTD